MTKKIWTIEPGDYKSTRNLCYRGKQVAILDQGDEFIAGWIAIVKNDMEYKHETPGTISYGLKRGHAFLDVEEEKKVFGSNRICVEYDLSTVRQERAGKVIKEVVIQGPDPYTMTIIADDRTQPKIIGKISRNLDSEESETDKK